MKSLVFKSIFILSALFLTACSSDDKKTEPAYLSFPDGEYASDLGCFYDGFDYRLFYVLFDQGKAIMISDIYTNPSCTNFLESEVNAVLNFTLSEEDLGQGVSFLTWNQIAPITGINENLAFKWDPLHQTLYMSVPAPDDIHFDPYLDFNDFLWDQVGYSDLVLTLIPE